MPRFQITGIGRDTGRNRNKIYKADNIDLAIEKASKDGTIVDTSLTQILPDEPATEAQIRAGNNMKLVFRRNISKDDMSLLLSSALEQEGVYYENLKKSLIKSLRTGKPISIIYRGGKQPKTIRKILPIDIGDDDMIEAKCCRTGIFKNYYISKMQLPEDGMFYFKYKRPILNTISLLILITKKTIKLLFKIIIKFTIFIKNMNTKGTLK